MCSKSSHQSDVGALSRRSKLGSERLSLDCHRFPLLKVNGVAWRHLHNIPHELLPCTGWFGNPCLRAVSKLSAAIMQITLKVKSMDVVEPLSPTLSLLEGSESWLVVMMDGSIHISRDICTTGYDDVKCTCSLMDISHASVHARPRLVHEYVRMVLVESSKRLDQAELHCMNILMLHLVRQPLHEPLGVQLETCCCLLLLVVAACWLVVLLVGGWRLVVFIPDQVPSVYW